jgi:hypothetical protein
MVEKVTPLSPLPFSPSSYANPGKTDAIFRVERGRMRNLWYPTKKAEYMTSTRFSELNLSRREDVGERDPMFRAYDNAEDLLPEEDVEEDGIAEMPAFSLAVCPPYPFPSNQSLKFWV